MLHPGTNLLLPTPYFTDFSHFKGDQSVTLGNQLIVPHILAKKSQIQKEPIDHMLEPIDWSKLLVPKILVVTSERIFYSRGSN